MDIETLKELFQKGLISYKPIFYVEVHNRVTGLVKSGMLKTRAVRKVAKEVGVQPNAVWKACRLCS